MSKLEQLIRQYLQVSNVMQLATSAQEQPWVCTVHYYSDENFNLYWISTEERRHSLEIKQNQKTAAAILVHENTPDKNYIIGLTVEGTAELLGSNPDEQISLNYAQKLRKDPGLMADIKTGKNPHKFYRLKPTKIVLFDTKEFPTKPRQELQMS